MELRHTNELGDITSSELGRYIHLYLDDQQQDTLLTPHYVFDVLPTTKAFQEFACDKLIELVEGDGTQSLSARHRKFKDAKEIVIEDELIVPVLEALGNKLQRRPSLIGSDDEADFCCYRGKSFATNYTNTTAVIEAKRHGRIERQYHILKSNNSDPIWQTLNYLRQINTLLNNIESANNVEHAILTDGYLWRIYSRRYTHDQGAYERHFIEFDLEAIAACDNPVLRAYLAKLFGYFLSAKSLAAGLSKMQSESASLETEVTKELRVQAFSALEYLATGLWRVIYQERNALKVNALENFYNIDVSVAHRDSEVRANLLKIVYDESVVLLLRLLFVLYAEDRNLFNEKEIPKAIKGPGNILEKIVEDGAGIGDLANPADFRDDYDRKLSKVFDLIDRHYDGRLFSGPRHLLLCDFDIDDELYARAIDDLCRVNVKGRDYTVDFASVSVREIGSIYESLLEYKLAIADEDADELPSIIDKKHMRYALRKGDLYLVNRKGERKSSGSYYTPDLIVEHLARTTIDPKLKVIREKNGLDFDAIYHGVLELTVCDPAMGSGHMLLAAYSHIVDFLRQCLEECAEARTTNRVWDEEIAYDVRTQVARRCIYGVDLNPVAVELAKLVLWMKSFRTDKPFEFFDYNLACGNSLIGSFIEENVSKTVEDTDGTVALGSTVGTLSEFEAEIQKPLLERVHEMLAMPRDTVAEVHAVEDFWRDVIRPLQEQLAFVLDMRLVKWLVPEGQKWVTITYEALLQGIAKDPEYVSRIINRDAKLNEAFSHLSDLYVRIRDTYKPLHWRIAFPHVAAKGGFDVVMSNPPWDLIKGDHRVFFSDYIEYYSDFSAAKSKAMAEDYMAKHPEVRDRWITFQKSIDIQNQYYRDAYQWQVVRDSEGKRLSSYNNLYKVFLEKIYEILKENGSCGVVVPDNLNIDKGCTGLRRLLLHHATIRELIMFENRLKLFDIDSRYKFDVLTFDKFDSPVNHSFRAGFYWYNPIWLDGEPDAESIEALRFSSHDLHTIYDYPIVTIETIGGEQETIYEFRNRFELDVFRKIMRFPMLGTKNCNFYASTYQEFNMTFDDDLFNGLGKGWPLYQGASIRFFNPHSKEPELFVQQDRGEARLAKRFKTKPVDLGDRQYRIAWRDVAQPTDSRSLICTVLPKGVFTGNTLSVLKLHCGEDINEADKRSLISGLNVVLSSMTADFYVRQRIAKHVSAFILKNLPVPRDTVALKRLGAMAMPLYAGEEMNEFRADVPALTDPIKRDQLIAKLDARVAYLYGLTYEEYQEVLSTFPLIEDVQKQRCLRAFNEISFLQ